jgi:hypothetical protein
MLLMLTTVVFGTTLGQKSKAPKLIVGIVIDQMCYDYLYRYQAKFSPNGFLKIMQQGTNCRNTHYNYVPTFTGPGHASIYTGTTPCNHGIVANEWYERETGKTINCVDDDNTFPVGTTSDDGKCSPKNLKTTTITDQLRLTYPEAKVISMSIKDRGAILPGGHLSNGSYWYDYSSGKFVTSSYFRNELPKWVNSFNDKKYVDHSMSKKWETLLNINEYKESGPDDSPYETLLGGKKTATFPYNLSEMSKTTPSYQLFTTTPFANTFLTDFALQALQSEELGKDAQTDMLCISFSTPDIAGHAFGPYSVELEDIYLRLDLELARLLEALEKQVGNGEFTLFLTADHAVVPVPQLLMDKKMPGGYVFLKPKMDALAKKVKQKYGTDLIATEENLNIYLNHERIDSLHINREEVSNFIANEIANWENVKAVYTAQQLQNSGNDNEWRDMVRRGFHPRESGDVLFILEPGYLAESTDKESAHRGTSHGSAFNYDTHVPLLWYGKAIPQQEINRRIDIVDISATLTQLLFLQRSGAMTGEPILELLK